MYIHEALVHFYHHFQYSQKSAGGKNHYTFMSFLLQLTGVAQGGKLKRKTKRRLEKIYLIMLRIH